MFFADGIQGPNVIKRKMRAPKELPMQEASVFPFEDTRVYTRCSMEIITFDKDYTLTITGGFGLYMKGKMKNGWSWWLNCIPCPWWPVKIESVDVFADVLITVYNDDFKTTRPLKLKKMLPYFTVNFSDPANSAQTNIYDIFVFTEILDDIPPSEDPYKVIVSVEGVRNQDGEDALVKTEIEYWAITALLTPK